MEALSGSIPTVSSVHESSVWVCAKEIAVVLSGERRWPSPPMDFNEIRRTLSLAR